jgi:hypothetical protein
MSQYRDDRDAARHRIEALEAKLAERDAALAAQGAALADREAEVVRLRRELERVGTTVSPGRPRPPSSAWTGPVVGAAVGLSTLAAILGAVVMRKAPPSVIVVSTPGSLAPAPALDLAPSPSPDPSVGGVADEPKGGLLDEEAMRRQLEPKVWSGRASLDEIKMLKAICSHMGDHSCRNRAAAQLLLQSR